MSQNTSTYINPLTDFGFKYLFGQEENKQFLLSFLNAVMQGHRIITDVEFVDKEMLSENKDGRALIYDLHCKTADGGKIIVEMQNRYQTYFKDRAVFYISTDIHKQGKKGENWDYRLTPVYGIYMMNFDWKEREKEQLREDICLMNIKSHEVFSDRIWMTFLKIPMMDKDAENCEDPLDKWLYILKNMERMEAMPHTFTNDPVFRRLGEVAKLAALDKEKRSAYEKSLKIYRDNYAIAMTERAEGRAEGIAEGRAEGRAEGIAEGIAKGVQIMSDMGIPSNVIAEKFNITLVKVEEILANNHY